MGNADAARHVGTDNAHAHVRIQLLIVSADYHDYRCGAG